ncbi:hypothetical protein VMCG_02031 [Cytospora schulzeri]|uniref:Uncharacterized protein n=1 Tax=Cytospora schulzeri TaxID=448051 RepID=A0A423X436_9PEZI|nr:hypothetical protein VMCG_02031 [Valsa malicola]
MRDSEYRCTVVYSVCGHTVLERSSQQVGGTQEESQHRWVHPVDPKQVPRSALFSRPGCKLVRSAVVDVAACLDSLFGQVHSRSVEEINFLHMCGPKYIEAANLIRFATIRWARRLACQNKPLPACPCPGTQEECHGLATPTSGRECKRGKKKGRPTPLISLPKSQRSLTFVNEKGDKLWIPGAHRTPSPKSQSAPARSPQSLSWCQRHGKVDASTVDMNCNRCNAIFLDESQVSPGSKLVRHHSAPAFPSQLYVDAAEGKCSCKILKHEVCSPCKARAQVSEREELEYGFF